MTHYNRSADNSIYRPYYAANIGRLLNRPGPKGSAAPLPYPAVAIYYGAGASHSWLWFVDILEAMGFWNLSFIDDRQIRTEGLDRCDAVLISGGDTFAIAGALGETGAREITRFVTGGGIYIGSCAGAYLPLNSSVAPLNHFNYVAAKISNLAGNLPSPRALPEKFCTPYGCKYVFHPVREAVTMTVTDFASRLQHHETVTAPLYGGPAFIPSEDARTVALYREFTPGTLYLVDPQLARDTLIGKAAIIAKRIGTGTMYLAGPHLEHPQYPAANTIVAEMLYGSRNSHGRPAAPFRPPAMTGSSATQDRLLRNIRSELSNSRIVALALERMPLRWQIGRKLYEPEKIRVFLEAMWRRWNIFMLQKSGHDRELYAINELAQEVTRRLRSLHRAATSENDDSAPADELFESLKLLTASFLSRYYDVLSSHIMNGGTT